MHHTSSHFNHKILTCRVKQMILILVELYSLQTKTLYLYHTVYNKITPLWYTTKYHSIQRTDKERSTMLGILK